MILLLEGPTGEQRVELVRAEPTLAGAVVGGVREMELAGRKVLGVVPATREAPVAAAADLILRLRRISAGLSEEEMALLLELIAF